MVSKKKPSGTAKSTDDAAKPTDGDSRLTSQQRVILWMHGIDHVSSLVRVLLVGATVVATAYFAIYKPVETSAGQTTLITHVVNFAFNLRLSIVLAWSAAAGTTFWAICERRQRMLERKKKDTRIAKLEKAIDPGRATSNMDVTGTRVLPMDGEVA